MANRRLRSEIFEAARGLHALGALDDKTLGELRTLADQSVRIVQAPQPLLASGALPLNRVTSVALKRGEDVVWSWTSTPDGGSYVSGYTIVQTRSKKRRKAARAK